MKKLVYTVFIVFWAAILTLLAVRVLTPQADFESVEIERDGIEIENGEPVDGHRQRFTLEDVAEHDTLDDCWMVIEGKVHDFTDYVPRHPAPPSVLEPWCGTEATEGMRSKGDDEDHSRRAWRLAENYRIGVVAEAN
ncbi:MAG: cytochrome b5-like heme/steroid binding domain-containing protein [Wenzhouxiangellaceae bacterium]|nr:cytochrome b5-like heme/steroid binding domain-containing protein [Wenzhouxiangellaceae bacterium]